MVDIGGKEFWTKGTFAWDFEQLGVGSDGGILQIDQERGA